MRKGQSPLHLSLFPYINYIFLFSLISLSLSSLHSLRLIAYVMSPNICAALGEVGHAPKKSPSKTSLCAPRRGGTDGDPRSQSCKLPVTGEMADTQLNRGTAN